MKFVFNADVYFLSNTIINCILLIFSIKSCKLNASHKKVFAVGSLGAFFSLYILFINNSFLSIMFKFTAIFFMCRLSGGKQSLKMLFKLVSLFTIYSLTLAGLLVVTNSAFYFFMNSYEQLISYTQLCAAFLMLYILSKTILKLLSRQTKHSTNYKTVVITNENVQLSLTGFCDSGNSLTATSNSLPVFITNKNILDSVLGNNFTAFDYVKCSTILGDGVIPIFKPEKIIVDNTSVEAYIGITDQNFYGDYDIILSENT